jgi:nitroreductase
MEMNILDAIRMRKSIRGYKPDPIPKALIMDIIEAAIKAPSAVNCQPWEFFVITGEPLLKIREGAVEKFRAGENPHSEHELITWTKDSVYGARQVELAKHIFQIMGIAREDKSKRNEWMERGLRYFDAPAAILICVDKKLSESGPLLDLGAVMQNICLSALHHGLGTCIEDQGVMYPEVVRQHTGISASKRLIIAIAIGFPDRDDVANTITSTREPVENSTKWIGFD